MKVLVPGSMATDDPDLGPGVCVPSKDIPKKSWPPGTYSNSKGEITFGGTRKVGKFVYIPVPRGECVKDGCVFVVPTISMEVVADFS